MEQQEKKEIRLELPEKVRQIIEQIQKHGFGWRLCKGQSAWQNTG